MATVNGFGPCCVAGHTASGSPQGKIQRLGGVDTYIAQPVNPATQRGRAVVIVTDVFGMQYKNNQILADALAAEGNYLVVVPDLFGGKPVPPSVMETLAVTVSGVGKPKATTFLQTIINKLRAFVGILMLVPALAPFMMKHKGPDKAPILRAVIKDLKDKHGITKVAVSGYCFGAKALLPLVTAGEVDVWAVAHGTVTPEGAKDAKAPGIVQCADNDVGLPESAREALVQAFKERSDSGNFKVNFYPGTFHGFAVRGDEKDEVVKAAKQKALHSTVEFFNQHF